MLQYLTFRFVYHLDVTYTVAEFYNTRFILLVTLQHFVLLHSPESSSFVLEQGGL